MSHPGHPRTYTKGNRLKGISPKPILPTPDEVAMLRRIARGYARTTNTGGGPQYHYDDGTPMPLRKGKLDPYGTKAFKRLVHNGWLIPQGDALIPGTLSQTYKARKP